MPELKEHFQMEAQKSKLSLIPLSLAVCRLNKTASIPSWATCGSFFSITKTDDELSVVCPERNVPANIMSEKGWMALKVKGPLDFSLTGVLASIATPLAEAGISIFAISTFETDYILVKEENVKSAAEILENFVII
jgi:hypothetical protein